jgi:hypothetical protein
MNCQECEEKIWIYQECTPFEQKKVEAHLLECASCRTVMEEAKQFNRQMAEARTPLPTAHHSAALIQRIMESLSVEKKVTVVALVVERFNKPWLQYPLRLAAMLLIFFFVRETTPTRTQMKFITGNNTVELNTIEFIKQLQQKRTSPQMITYYKRYQKIKQTNI